MKSLAVLLNLLLLTAATWAQIRWSEWHDENNNGQPFRWRNGREDVTTDERLYKKARPGLEIFGPAVDTHLTYSFNSTLYCEIQNNVSRKTMVTHVSLLDSKGAVVYEWPNTEVLPGMFQRVNQEVNPDPRFKYHWDFVIVEWKDYVPGSATLPVPVPVKPRLRY